MLFSLSSLISQGKHGFWESIADHNPNSGEGRMRSVMDIVREWEMEQRRSSGNSIDGRPVAEIVWETPRSVVFRDSDGRIWRRVHSWGMTWPITIDAKEKK